MNYNIEKIIERKEKILCVSINKEKLIIGGTSKELTYYDLKTMKSTVLCCKDKSIRSIAQNTNIIACASYDGTGVILKDMCFFDNIEGPETEVKGISINQDNKYVALATRGKQVWILKLTSEFVEIESVLNDHTQDVKGVRFNDTRLFSFGYDCTIKMNEKSYNGEDKGWVMVQSISEHLETVWDIDFLEEYLISCDNDGIIVIFKLDDNGFYQFFKSKRVSRYPIYSIKIILEKFIAFVYNRFYVMIIDFDFIPVLFIDKIHNNEINCIDWCPENNILVTGGDDGKVNILKIL